MSRREPRVATIALLLVAAFGGCAGTDITQTPVYRVERGTFEVKLDGHGELQAEQATPIECPQNLDGVQRVSWLLEEGAPVEEGDVVARLDRERLAQRVRRARDAVRKLDLQIEAKKQALARERTSVVEQVRLLEQERDDAERYAPKDAALFSRLEIIDAQIDQDLLGAKIAYYGDKLGRYEERATAEIEILELQRRTEEVKLQQAETALDNLDVAAPHAGVFLHARNWRGEKVRVGSTVWRGQTIGELPDLDRMQARAWILESEAAGLAPGLEARVVLDAHLHREFRGEVEQVQPIANPLDRRSPVKYFEILVSLDETNTEIMHPGSRVGVTIFVERRADQLAIPNQAIFQEAGEVWAWVREGGRFVERPVSIGERSISRTIVLEGLDEGDVVALADPNEVADEEPS